MNSQNQLLEYESQLLSVQEALKQADNSQRDNLLDLKNKLEEVLLLLRGEQTSNLQSDENVADVSTEKSNIDDEFERFQREMAMLEDENVSSKESVETANDNEEDQSNMEELINAISSLEGSKCRAPFSQPWGEKEYHNAIIVTTNFDPDCMETMEDVEVEVMFCYPICNAMKPCPFFLDGRCKFPNDQCRFSHGYPVKFSELQEFVLPNYSNVVVDSKCLAKSYDGLWYRATIEKCLDDQKYIIKYDKNKETETLDAESIVPLDIEDEDDDTEATADNNSIDIQILNDNNSDSLSYKSDSLDRLSNPPPLSVVFWEQHTRGIASKLMEKMGHIWGQGLGKNSDGRLDPVEAIILPSGKSLDKCIEMRENFDMKGPISIETRLAIEQDKEEQRAKKAKRDFQPKKKETIFDFLNRKIAKAKGDRNEIIIKKTTNEITKERSKFAKDLNIEAFTVGEDIKKTRKEIFRLRQSLNRNSDRNEVIRVQVEKKIASQNNLLKNLQAKEQKINQEIKSQANHKKLAVF